MSDLDRANQFASKRRAERERDARRFAGYQKRTKPVRDRVRAEWFLRPLVRSGVVTG